MRRRKQKELDLKQVMDIEGEPADLKGLVGKVVTIIHDSGTWSNTGKIFDKGYGSDRYWFVNRLGEKSVLCRPIDESRGEKLSHVADNIYMLSTPHGGGGMIYDDGHHLVTHQQDPKYLTLNEFLRKGSLMRL